MIYWYLSLAVCGLAAALALIYGAVRGLVFAAFGWHRSREVLQKLGYAGPKEMLSRMLRNLLWTAVAAIGLVLAGMLFQWLG
jgi:hypothetical protein